MTSTSDPSPSHFSQPDSACPVCQTTPRTIQDGWWVCPGCGLLERHGRPDNQAELVERLQSRDNQSEPYWQLWLERLNRWFPERGLVMEIGCGTGELLAKLAQSGWTTAGLEPDPCLFQLAQTKLGTKTPLYSLPLEQLPAEFDHRCEVVLLIDVLEHLDNPSATISRLADLLKPGGQLIIQTPNPSGIRHRLSGPQWEQQRDLTHIFLYPEKSLTRLLLDHGFFVEQMTTTSGKSDDRWLRRVVMQFVSPVLKSLMLGNALLVRARRREDCCRNPGATAPTPNKKGQQMIHTITFAPAVDLTIRLDSLNPGAIHCPVEALYDPGGKGMNVSSALQQLGVESIAWTILGGFHGERWAALAQATGIPIRAIRQTHETRQNVKLFETGPQRQSDLNFPGPDFNEDIANQLLDQLRSELAAGDWVVIAGRGMRNTPALWWQTMASVIRDHQARMVVDITMPDLACLAGEHPFLIKINCAEYSQWRGVDCPDWSAVREHATTHRVVSSDYLVITDGPAGVWAMSQSGQEVHVPSPAVEVAGCVGAGDACLAGMLAGWQQGETQLEPICRWGVATASAAVELSGTRFGSRDRVQSLLESMATSQPASEYEA